jgi:hypothetical protein
MSACAACSKPLVLYNDSEDEFEGENPPDDLQLPCNCHFHWQCLLDTADAVAISLRCPNCDTSLAANAPGPSVTNPIFHASQGVAIPTRYHSEGGLQEDYDILPILTEEAYLASHEEERPARAFLTMCAEGDVEGIMALLGSADLDDEETLGPQQILRYQDVLNGGKSGLHLALENDKIEVFYLLLWLASRLPTSAFPENVARSAHDVGLARPENIPDPDIRALKDEKEETAEAYARRKSGMWEEVLQGNAFGLSW